MRKWETDERYRERREGQNKFSHKSSFTWNILILINKKKINEASWWSGPRITLRNQITRKSHIEIHPQSQSCTSSLQTNYWDGMVSLPWLHGLHLNRPLVLKVASSSLCSLQLLKCVPVSQNIPSHHRNEGMWLHGRQTHWPYKCMCHLL
jgi:hypothetical protein